MQNMTQPKIFTRGSKLWVRFSLDQKVIRKPLNLDDTKANLKLAKTQIIPQLILKVNTGEFFENKTVKIPFVDDYINISFSLHKDTRRLSTQIDYKNIYNNHIKEYFGKKRLDIIKVSDIRLWQSTLLEKGLSASRVRAIRCVFTTMFRDAIEDEIINKNPISIVRTPKILQTEIYPFSLDEITSILNVTNGWVKNFLALAFFTGLRSGELIGLKWSDIDFKNKEISIKRAIKMGVISLPKTINSIRVIDMLDTLIPFLNNQYKLTGKNDSYVFLNKDNEHIYDIKRVRDTHWKNALKSIGLEYRPIYHTRHTFATLMIENNEDVLWVANMLGHKDSTMTLSKYARYIKRANKQRASFLNELKVS